MSESKGETTFEVDNTHKREITQINVPPRILMGPGPSNAHPRVLSALGMRQVGHLDPAFINIMNETQDLLRYTMQTKNKVTLPMSGTGSCSMEATFANLVEDGTTLLIPTAGYFALRMANMAERYGGKVVAPSKAWGSYFTLEELEEHMKKVNPDILCLVHADTSTGCLQPLEGVKELCEKYNALLLVDTVTSLGGMPLYVDKWGIDACYSGSQKCLSCPPGISPLSMSEKALEHVKNRKTGVKNWYLDLNLIGMYWSPKRTYHHTAPINMNYALRESLRLIAEESLDKCWARHKANAQMMWDGLEKLGLKLTIKDEKVRLWSLIAVNVPEGVDEKGVRAYVLKKYNLEIGGGLGQFAGKIWRIGLMGFNSRPENVKLCLAALEEAIQVCKK